MWEGHFSVPQMIGSIRPTVVQIPMSLFFLTMTFYLTNKYVRYADVDQRIEISLKSLPSSLVFNLRMCGFNNTWYTGVLRTPSKKWSKWNTSKSFPVYISSPSTGNHRWIQTGTHVGLRGNSTLPIFPKMSLKNYFLYLYIVYSLGILPVTWYQVPSARIFNPTQVLVPVMQNFG